jgi:uncharacterized membrane protein YhaH (DUF805 family)
MSMFNTLFSVKGRIRRKTYWLASLGITVVMLAVILGELVFTGQLLKFPSQAETLLFSLVSLATVFPLTAIMVKRLNDIEWPAWLGYAMGMMELVLSLAAYLAPDTFYKLTPVQTVLNIWLAVAVVLFVVVGLKRGTIGANAHGPDPLSVI